MTDYKSLNGERIWVAGQRGMVGSAITRRLAQEDCEVISAGRSELDLCRQSDVADWMAVARPSVIFLAAGKVGGILANRDNSAEFIYENLMIEANIIHAAWRFGVKKLLFLGSSCIYPKHAKQPITEDALLSGELEPTNEAYAIAKIAGIKLCQNYRKQYNVRFVSAMPTNLYGPNDNFDLASSHVLPALLAKMHKAKIANKPSVDIWGSGTPKREFLHVDDLADALVHLMKVHETDAPVNVGCGEDISISDLAQLIKSVVGFEGSLIFDRSKPDGTPRKLLDVSRLKDLGWRSSISLQDGIKSTYEWYLARNEISQKYRNIKGSAKSQFL